MGLRLPSRKNIWEALTPMDEGAQRKAEASLKAANQQIQAGKGFKYGKLASPQARQQYVENNKTPTFNLASATAKSFFTKAVPTVGAGAARSAVGGLEGLSGTYDLFTPGKGTSRVTKGLVGAGGAVDRFVDRNNLDKTGYKISQATGDLAQFLAPSAVAQGLSKAGKFSKAAKFASSTAPLINKGGRFARYASTPANVLNTAIATGKQQGYLTARDKDVNAKTVGASVAGNLALGAGLNMAGSKIVDKLARRKGVKPVATPKQDVTLKSRELTPEQIQARETRKTQDMMWDNLSPAARKSQEAARKKSLWKDEGDIFDPSAAPAPVISHIAEPVGGVQNKFIETEDLSKLVSGAIKGGDVIEKPNPALKKFSTKLIKKAKSFKTVEEFIASEKKYLHGSTESGLTSLKPGAETGLNEKKGLVYLTDDNSVAESYTKVRGGGTGLGVLTNSKTGKVYDVNLDGKVIDAYDFEELSKLKAMKGFDALSGKTKNQITNPTGLSSDILENNEELRKFLLDNGYSGVRAKIPNGAGTGSEIIVLDARKASIVDEQRLREVYEAARKKSLWKDEGGAVLGPQNSPVLKKLGITSSKGMDASTERQMVKDYFEGKPTVKGSALTGEGAQVPTRGLSSEAKAKLIANARKQTLRRNQEGSILSPQESPIVKKIQEAFTPKPLNTETNITSVREKYSPDRFIRENVTRPAVNKVKQAVYKASVSENPLARGAAKTVMGVNREIGTPEELLAARRKMFGTSEMGKLEGKNTADLTKDVQSESQRRIWATLDPAQASKMGVTATEADLTPDELKLQQNLKKTIDETTQGNLERGLITPEQAANESYIRRAYEPFETAEDPKVYQEVKSGLLKQFKGRKEVDQSLIEQAITDPAYLVGRKQALSAQAWAHVDYANHLADNGYVFDSARKGLVQLPTNKLYGRAAGKWVAPDVMKDFEGFKYQNSMVNAFNDLVTAYDRLGLRRLKKEMLTVFNPAVRLGNQLSNRVAFSTLNGHNPVEFNIAMQKTKGMIKSQDPLYKEAVQQGLIGTDIVQGDFTQNLAKYVDDPNILKQSKDWVRKSYSEADDRARLASYILHRKQGYSPSDAATLTQRGFQDYKSVGWMFDMAAKTPVIGNAFVRFSSDATRILSNALIDHPLRTISTVALYGAMNNAMSKISGESEEDKATREGRFGAPKIPFTNVSLETQTPWGAVNVARFMPFYQLNDVNSPIDRFLPIQSNPLKPSGWNDPLLGQALQVATDQDFRGKSIQDPQNTTYDSKGNVKKFPELPADERRDNLLRFLGVQNAPLGREVDSILSAVKKTPDIYGKERSLPQAIARSMGVKVEQYGEEQAAKQRSTNEFFEGNIERVKQFNKENPDLEQAYYTFNNPTRDRKTGKKTSNLVSPERWKVVSADASGRLYNFLRSEAELANQKDGKPIDPVYRLPTPEQQKQVLELRSRPTGDDIETEEILRATQPWYKAFEKAERDYYSANSKYYSGKGLPDSQNARVKEYAAVKYPEQSPLVQKYYQVKASDPTAGKEFFKANADALSTAFQTYKDQRLRYINAKRKIEGFPPISANAFNNVTFGYEDDERKVYNELKYGKGYGSYGSGGSARVNAAKYLQDRPSVGTTKVKVSAKAPQIAVKARNTGASKPKVSIKKSRV